MKCRQGFQHQEKITELICIRASNYVTRKYAELHARKKMKVTLSAKSV